jgi:lipoprotein-anchoring transpeptidase ErfK/SrfK
VEACGCYEEASVKSDDVKLTKAVSDANKMLGTKVVYDWNGSEVVLDDELLKDWVSIEDDEAVLDESAVKTFVNEQAAEYDTYGKTYSFTTSLGVTLTLSRKNYGWKTDRGTETEELIELIKDGSTCEREPSYSVTAQKKGTEDIGSSYVEADLTNQHMYVYQNSELVLESDFVSGTLSSTADCVTPQGIFGLLYKTRNAVLRGATYETPVNYWMPFYGNYGMHDAYWRSSFGGDIYVTRGSHGCINLPPASAVKLYDYVSTGFPVVCYYYTSNPLDVVNEPLEETAPMDETVPAEESETEAES